MGWCMLSNPARRADALELAAELARAPAPASEPASVPKTEHLILNPEIAQGGRAGVGSGASAGAGAGERASGCAVAACGLCGVSAVATGAGSSGCASHVRPVAWLPGRRHAERPCRRAPHFSRLSAQGQLLQLFKIFWQPLHHCGCMQD